MLDDFRISHSEARWIQPDIKNLTNYKRFVRRESLKVILRGTNEIDRKN